SQSPFAGDFDGDGRADLLWYAPGKARLWRGSGTGFGNVAIPNVYGRYAPVVGDFNGDHRADVLWYAAGAGADSLWRGGHDGFAGGPAVTVGGDYLPTVGDYNGDGKADVFWLNGTGNSHTWFGRSNGFADGADTIGVQFGENTLAIPAVADFSGDGHDDML